MLKDADFDPGNFDGMLILKIVFHINNAHKINFQVKVFFSLYKNNLTIKR